MSEQAVRTFAAKHKRLQDLAAGGATGATVGTRNGAEAEYAEAYQVLVRYGEAPQIRKKYRGGH
jgi:hypothetical protein